MTLIHLFPVVGDENCQLWEKSFVEVINTEGTNSYPFNKGAGYSSYQLEPLISYRNSTTGEWQFFNLSGNVLVLQNGPDLSQLSQIKVTVYYFSNSIETIGMKDTLLINQLIKLLHMHMHKF